MGNQLPPSISYCVVWFKRDLRVIDHAPLAQAVATGLPIIPLYIIEPKYWKLPDVSRRHWYFIHDSLVALRHALTKLGAPLTILTGEVLNIFNHLYQTYGAFQLYSHEETGNAWTYTRDKQVKQWCISTQVIWEESPSHGVIRRLGNRDRWATLRNGIMQHPIITPPKQVRPYPHLPIHPLLGKNHPLFGFDVQHVQLGGRDEGIEILYSFLNERAAQYMTTISKPGISAHYCSRLSPHIAYGTLSVREIEQLTYTKIQSLTAIPDEYATVLSRNLSAFLSRLAWRCHFVQKLEQQPEIEWECMHPFFEGMREPHFNLRYFEAWTTGTTGYPLIDACMRSLHANGWITFRMRALLVSFASYHLWLDWRQTAPFLAQLFTDYEPGIHYSQFQMQSGVTGINALRIYNPIKQSYDHDPQGNFIKRYVPELRQVPMQWIHEPWCMPSPPKGYPSPIVNNDTATSFAKHEITLRRQAPGFKEAAKNVLHKLGSRHHRTQQRQKKSDKQLELDF